MNTELLTKLKELLPSEALVLDPDTLASHASDWSKEDALIPACVVRPDSTEQLAAVLALCNDYGQAVVTQGGLSGLSGGATPQAGEIAISLSRLSGIVELDTKGQCITVKAGTRLQEIQEAAAEAGFKLALDLGARGICTIGGNLSTNAGGNQVIKYGMAREQVLGLEVVRADGTIIRAMNRMLKNNAGYDVKQLFIGSEGTLGIITECVLRLRPKPLGEHTALCACADFDAVISLLNSSQAAFGGVSAFEVMWHSYYQYATTKVEHTRNPFGGEHAYYVLLQVEGNASDHANEYFLATLAQYMEKGLLQDVVVAQSERETQDFWAIRDAIAEILGMVWPLANFDIGVPIKHMEAFVQRVESELKASYPDLTVLVFGHIGDGNLHIGASNGDHEIVASIYADVYRIAADYGATVTAEHGIGVHKKQYLHYSRGAEDIQLMRELKRTLDPNNILNPGRIFDPE